MAITADDDTLRRVLVNLVNNAVKYSPAGGTIRVSTRREPPVAHLRVEDKGLGIPAQQLEAIFEAYVRVESEATARIEGVGLGLPIVRQIVEKHDGELWAAQNADGVGSTFHVTLPLERPGR